MSKKHVLVTGSSGVIGTQLVELLIKNGCNVRVVYHKRESRFQNSQNIEIVRGDLTDYNFCTQICKGVNSVYHLAVESGSIVKNAKHPASIMTSTILMDFNMLKAAYENEVEKYLYSSCSCIYPEKINDMRENLAWEGPPPKMHETISWSKRIAELQCQSFNKEYGMKIAIVRPSNTYGPNDILDIENSHVISSFIKKALDHTDPFIIWGNGEQIREFIFSRDIAYGMISALENYCNADPINLSGGTSIKIKDLASLIINIVNYSPEIKFDLSKPTGHMKRVLNSKKCKEKINFKPITTLEEGLKETISWYQKNKN